MPPHLPWLHRLPDIVAQIKGLSSPAIDRSVIEQIFQVQRRQAHELIVESGAHQLGSGRGRTLVLTRDELVARLGAVVRTEEFERTWLRKQSWLLPSWNAASAPGTGALKSGLINGQGFARKP